ncbi:MAG: UDP-3-O-(3-hydroxymyristoyl)glucosamine N-acyltransferase [Bacteroidetes bacterium HGW-Bacteroidetes-6]|jgi:UDP-3-O-[3-hydroxymyristoyl] glucosamine N-acyltransferase|nr:MAG: UDP-3-O-(3-hydroxymyristoyl)glucosamine N-acyltransferase [Bacteroidetes bacterium HGW-Bacteroidetes-6]
MKFSSNYTLKQIIDIIGREGTYSKCDPNFVVSGINEIHRVEPGDLTFVDHPKYYNKALASAATTVIINKDVEVPAGKALIISDDPFRDYVAIVKHFKPFISSESAISPTAEIGEGTIIEPFVFIGHNVKIGKNCLFLANCTIHADTIIGDNVIINSGTVIGGEAFYFKRRPDMYDKLEGCGRVIIEDNVEIGSCCTVDRGVSGDTIVGWGTKMDNHIQVGHDTVIGRNCLISSQVGIAGVVTLEDDVILWGQVGVQKDLVIGKGAVVLGQSGVAKTLEGNKTYFGSPVREAVDKMKELALIKRLPEVFERLK